jgi:hypothetical protein
LAKAGKIVARHELMNEIADLPFARIRRESFLAHDSSPHRERRASMQAL